MQIRKGTLPIAAFLCIAVGPFACEDKTDLGYSSTSQTTGTDTDASGTDSDTAGTTTGASTSDTDGGSGTDVTSTDTGDTMCGDGILDVGEECDQGVNNADDGFCTLACKNASCGDGLVGPGEPCDDGNAVDADGCEPDCTISPGVAKVHAGGAHTCARFFSGAVRCWGEGDSGRLGYGNVDDIGDDESPSSAGDVDLGSATVIDLAVGGQHTCALLNGGNVRCWGSGSSGQTGYAHKNAIGDDETPASAANLNVGATMIALAAGDAHTCALRSDGGVQCWGEGDSGRLGYGNTNDVGDDETPLSAGIVNVGASVQMLVAGEAHTCGLLSGGKVRCWGEGDSGRLGYGNTNDIGDNETPLSAGDVPVGGNVETLAAGSAHTCALMAGGKVRCWGEGDFGRLGYGNTDDVGDDETPQAIGNVDVGGPVLAIAAGGAHTCALLEDGKVRCWGAASSGQIGYGNIEPIGDDESPVVAGDVTVGAEPTWITAGGAHSCVRTVIGAVRCWGEGDFGRLGYVSTNDIGDDEDPGSAGNVPLF